MAHYVNAQVSAKLTGRRVTENVTTGVKTETRTKQTIVYRMSKHSKDGSRKTSAYIADVKKSVCQIQDTEFAMQWDVHSTAFKKLPQPLRHAIIRVQKGIS